MSIGSKLIAAAVLLLCPVFAWAQANGPRGITLNVNGLSPAANPFATLFPAGTAVPPLLTGAESDGTNLNLTWGNQGGSSLVAAPSIVAPDGTTGAVKLLKEDGSNGVHSQFCAPTGNPPNFTVSVYAKPSGGATRYLVIAIGNASILGKYASFDLTSGIVVSNGSNGTGGGATIVAAKCEAAVNSFFKCTLSISAMTTGVAYSFLSLATTPAATGIPSYQGDNASGLYVWRIKETTP